MDARIRNFVGRVGERGVRVDRDYSPFGNPFHIHRQATRRIVIAQFAIYLHCHIDTLWPTLFTLRGKKLLCHCQPERCHAEVLAMVANGIHDSAFLSERAWLFLDGDGKNGPLTRFGQAAEVAPLHTPRWHRANDVAIEQKQWHEQYMA